MKKSFWGLMILMAALFLAPAATGAADDTDANTARFFAETNVIRSSGTDRYATAICGADNLKKILGKDRFDCIIIACGTNYPDALAGSYLSARRDAPILLVGSRGQGLSEAAAYIDANLSADGQVLILGGSGAVPTLAEQALYDVCENVRRLRGSSRYETNLEILRFAGIDPGSILLIADGSGFADALSASALNLPILLVDKRAGTLSSIQREFIAENTFEDIYILGGTGAVPAAFENELGALSPGSLIRRISGRSRYDTSMRIAETFFDSPANIVVATGEAFPDGLTGGVLAKNLGAPMILLNKNVDVYENVALYVWEQNVENVLILGGTGAVPGNVEEAITPEASLSMQVMDMESALLDSPTKQMLDSPWNSSLSNGDVTIGKVSGHGLNGTSAIRYTVNNPRWSSSVLIRMDGSGYRTDLSMRGADVFWFWVDTSASAKSVDLEPRLWNSDGADVQLRIGRDCMLWDGSEVRVLTSSDSYNGYTGRLRLPKYYKGFVGIPFTCFYDRTGDRGAGNPLDLSCLRGIMLLHSNAVSGDTMYIDEFWVTDSLSLPNVTFSEIKTVINTGVSASQDYYVQTDPSDRHQTIKAYGVSDCWWSNGIGTKGGVSDIQEYLFTDRGIGLNNYRINVGGSVKSDKSDGPAYEPDWRAVLSPLGEDGSLDITRNSGGWGALMALRELEGSGRAQVYDYTIFMNSPPSTMTDNGQTFYNNKLKDDCYEAYADYVCDVTAAYLAAGIPVRYVSPVNEPTIGAWKTNTGQEACVYTTDQAIRVYKLVAAELAERRLPVRISIGDYSNWDDAHSFLKRIENTAPELFDVMDHISAHDYGTVNALSRSRVVNYAKKYGLEIHMTEWCMAIADKADNMDTALDLAEMIYTDHTTMDITSWTWWLGVGHGGYTDGLMYVTGNNTDYETTKRFWALGNYSRFTLGTVRIGVNEEMLTEGVHAVAYTDAAPGGSGRLVYVLMNENDSARTITIAGLPSGSKGSLYETSDQYCCSQRGYVDASHGIVLDAKSVVTIVFDGMDMSRIDSAAVPGITVPRCIADFEGLSGELYSQGIARNDNLSNITDYNSADITAGRGADGTKALAYTFKASAGEKYWAQALKLDMDAAGYAASLSGASMFWFYVDTGSFASGCRLDLWINDHKPMTGAKLYCRNGNGIFELNTLAEAWNGAGFGRLTIPAGFKGYLGLNLSAFDGLTEKSIKQLYFYTETGSFPASLYLDDFWLTEAASAPPGNAE